MALSKTTVSFGFGKGIALKDAEYLVPMGKFLSLQNCVFDTLAQLKKRNGFGILTSTVGSISYLTTFKNNLIGLGSSIQSYSGTLNQFVDKGTFPQIQLTTVPLSNVQFGQTYADLAISNNGLMCAVTVQPVQPAPISTTFTWTVYEQATGQIISGPTQIVSSGGTERLPPKVFAVGSQFVVLYDAMTGAVSSAAWLQYVTIPTSSPFTVSSVTQISSSCYTSGRGWFDCAVASTSGLYVSWLGNLAAADRFNVLVNPITKTQGTINRFASVGNDGDIVSVTQDSTTTPFTEWTAFASSNQGPGSRGTITYFATTPSGSGIINSNPTTGSGSIVISSSSFAVNNVVMTAQNGSMTAYVEVQNSYSYDDSKKDNLIYKQQMGTTGSVTSALQFVRGAGLASKGFIINSTSHVMMTYLSAYQTTYFLMNKNAQVEVKLAYGNGNNNGYFTNGLSNINVVGSAAYVPYLFQTTIQPVGTGTNVGSQSIGVYGPLGVGMAEFNFGMAQPPPKEIGQNLILGGGFLGAYDGKQFTENNFFLGPDNISVVGSSSLGSLVPQTYSYQAIYNWVDNKGNNFNSLTSVPISITVSSGTSLILVKIPTLRISYKNYPYGGINTPIQIKLFRWSTAQPLYYLTQNFIQDGTVSSSDFASFIDTRSDSQIIGGEILYTNGGIVDDINGPATKAMTTFDSRLWAIDGGDQNLLWFSKQVIENTPVEMSDFLTFYVAPNVGAEGPTGIMNCLAPMDDKLIIFKDSALYYINGRGPDNTGAQNQYSDPIFITSAVGCANQNSIVLIPNGLMFQSSKGIWLLGRDLSTQYIGKDVETLVNTNTVLSVLTVPNTNQVRITLNTGVVLLYDYFVGEWGTFNGIPGISSTLYNGLHTYVNSSSSIRQETPGLYSDGTNPVLMSFTTGWIGLSGLQGYQRAYKFYLLGTYYTPHNFTLGIGYDYNSQITQTITVNPTNTVGSGSQVEQGQLNFINQSCQSFQLTFNEVASQSAGQGLTISGLDLVYGQIKGYPRNTNPKNQTS
jgi:hypothetical protein